MKQSMSFPTPFHCSLLFRVLVSALLLALSGCSAQTGIPAHGGGKRFAIEQELVAAATRTALKQIDLSPLRGKQVDVYVHSMGDAGAGNLSGGRFGLVSQVQRALRQTENFQLSVSGQGSQATWRNSEELNVDDQQYLSGLVMSYLLLNGIRQAPPSEAEATLHFILDVFGTSYTRVDWLLANNEILTARTGLEVFAVDTETGEVLLPPRTAAAEAEYNEQYVLWSGPIKASKSVKKAEPLMVDFTDVLPGRAALSFDQSGRPAVRPSALTESTEREVRPRVPFQREWDQWQQRRAEQAARKQALKASDPGAKSRKPAKKRRRHPWN